MTTIELTRDKLDLLIDGAENHGRCALLVESEEGDDVFVVVVNNHRKGRPPKRAQRAGANLGEAPAPPETGRKTS